MSILVRFHNLPLHFWHHKVLVGIGNLIGRYIKIDTQRTEEGIYTFLIIFVEVDLNKGLLDHILFKHNAQCWTQFIDFENKTFRCPICQQIGNIQNTCPTAKKDPRRKKKLLNKAKGWKFPQQQSKDKEDDEETNLPINQETQNRQEIVENGGVNHEA